MWFSTLKVRQVFARLDAQVVGATLGKTDGLFSLPVHVKESKTGDSSRNWRKSQSPCKRKEVIEAIQVALRNSGLQLGNSRQDQQ